MSGRVRIKLCGMTRIEDARAAAELGADAVGLVFAAGGPRALDPARGAAIARALPPLVTRVALFLDQDADFIARVLATVPVELLQFHGREDAAFCRAFGKPWLKVVPMADVVEVPAFAAAYPDAAGFVLDSHGAGAAGGSGRTVDWSRAAAAVATVPRPLLLAGGLRPENVNAAVTAVKPWAVDASSGVEASPGIKDHARMAAFIDEVRRGSA
ncbi:MAG: phosphoribosylanthranilate isomerase [Xanthomonadaceae bacterium]|jgi:phosphoribosylanthranilate isomerase|nr:phosphoribosylanthranilate isomerase [Xanthomonadaceae bacterium]